jgi:serine/threonine protein kinase
MKKQLPVSKQNILFLLWTSFRSLVSRSSISRKSLPNKAREYSLVSEIDPGDINKPHVIGIYKNKSGKKAIGKIWSGNLKNFTYYSLMHDAFMHQRIGKLHNLAAKFANLGNVTAPTLIDIKAGKSSLFVLTEYKKGIELDKYDTKTKTEIYLKILNYLNTLFKYSFLDKSIFIPSRTQLDFTLLFPFFITLAILRNPLEIFKLLKAIPYILKTLWLLNKLPIGIVHRDLHSKNVLVNKKEIVIIDLGRIVKTFAPYEIITTLAAEWFSTEYRHNLLRMLYRLYPAHLNIIRGLLLYFSIHALTAGNLPKRHIDRYKAMLRFGVFEYDNYFMANQMEFLNNSLRDSHVTFRRG